MALSSGFSSTDSESGSTPALVSFKGSLTLADSFSELSAVCFASTLSDLASATFGVGFSADEVCGVSATLVVSGTLVGSVGG